VAAARSTNGGQTWSEPIALDVVLDTQDAFMLETALAADGAGNWIAAWTSNREDSGGGFDIWTARSPNGGLSWLPAERFDPGGLGQGPAGDQAPVLASNGAGEWRLAWAERSFAASSQRWAVKAARSLDNGAFWSAPQTLDVGEAFLAGAAPESLDPAPALGVDGSGGWLAAWTRFKALCSDEANGDADIALSRTGAPGSEPAASRFSNISTRGRVGTGDQVMIAGFIVEGTAPKTVLINGRGPSLAPFGVPDVLANPTLRLFSGQAEIGFNDNWRSRPASEVSAIQATGRGPTNDFEAALLPTLAPGAYTVHMAGVAGGQGNGLVEVWDQSPGSASRLSNISTRGLVGSGDDVMIAGFIVEGEAPKALLVNGLGPTLAPFGVPGVLANPTLRLFEGPQQFAFNDDWTTLANMGAIVETGRAPSDAREAAALLSLPPGAYTAHLGGANGGTGNGLAELWEVDSLLASECDDGSLLPRPAREEAAPSPGAPSLEASPAKAPKAPEAGPRLPRPSAPARAE
jgi:hypothetical protein